MLELSLVRLAQVVARTFHFDHRDAASAGAARGLGFGLLTFCTARIRSGFEVVAEATDLRARIECADIVITGEGKLRSPDFDRERPGRGAELARSLGKPVFAIVGQAAEDAEVRQLFDRVTTLRGTRPTTANRGNARSAGARVSSPVALSDSAAPPRRTSAPSA